MKGLGGFRSLLVHGYTRLDPELVLGHLQAAPGRFADFSRAVRAWLEAAAG